MATSHVRQNKPFRKVISSSLKDIFAAFVWAYVSIKLFVFDIDEWLSGVLFPDYTDLAVYRYFIFLALSLILFLALGRSKFLLLVAWIVFFPLILLFWRVPKKLYRRDNWFWIFTYVNTLISSFKPFKRRLFSLFLISFSLLLVYASSNPYLLGIGVGLIIIFLGVRLVTQTYKVFQPMKFLAVDAGVLVKFLKSEKFQGGITKFFDDSAKTSSDESKVQSDESTPLAGRKTNLSRKRRREVIREASHSQKQVNRLLKLQNLILYNRAALLLATNLKKYREAKVYMMFIVLDFMVTFFLAILSFATINLGIYKIEPANFKVASEPSSFLFFYYSFHAVFTNQIAEIVPKTPLASIVFMSEVVTVGIFVLAIAASTFAAIRAERYDKELDTLIETMKEQGGTVEEQIKNEFNITTIQHGVEVLRNASNSSVQLIMWLTTRIDL